MAERQGGRLWGTGVRMLYFYVKGSAKEPYKVTADGIGSDLKLFCTCPAGRKGGVFCKHQQALLLGEVTNLVEPSDSVADLARCAIGSAFVTKAMTHVPVSDQKPVVRGFDTLEEVRDKFARALEDKGYVVAIAEDVDPWRAKALQCFGLGKHGKMLKYPVLSLTYDEQTADLVVKEDGGSEYRNFRPRVRPWGVRSRAAGSIGTWRDLSQALPHFLKTAGLTDWET